MHTAYVLSVVLNFEIFDLVGSWQASLRGPAEADREKSSLRDTERSGERRWLFLSFGCVFLTLALVAPMLLLRKQRQGVAGAGPCHSVCIASRRLAGQASPERDMKQT